MLIGDGLLQDIPTLIEHHAPATRYAIITDSTVEKLYGDGLVDTLGGDERCALFSFRAGEQSKTCATWASLTDQLLSARFGRDATVIALGGGVAGDIGGFVAATYLRGIPHIQVPTSLLAMIDSSVGGKTGVDTPHGKNLVGAFHQPSLVVTDVATLKTLPATDFRAGIAEAIKHGAIADSAYLERLCGNREQLSRQEPEALLDLVGRSVAIKAEVVAADEREHGRRAALNFGHTIGHAVEAASSYGVPHGEAVAIGMLAEADLGRRMGITEPRAVDRLREMLELFQLPVSLREAIGTRQLLAAIAQDKKTRERTARFTLIEDLGAVARGPSGSWTHPAPDAEIDAVLRSLQ